MDSFIYFMHIGGPFMWAQVILGPIALGVMLRNLVRPAGARRRGLSSSLVGLLMGFGLLGTAHGMLMVFEVFPYADPDQFAPLYLSGCWVASTTTLVALFLAGLLRLVDHVGSPQTATGVPDGVGLRMRLVEASLLVSGLTLGLGFALGGRAAAHQGVPDAVGWLQVSTVAAGVAIAVGLVGALRRGGRPAVAATG